MLEIKKLVEQMKDELCDVKDYSILALKYRTSDPELGEMYHSLASQELEHYEKLHTQATHLVNKTKEKNNTPSGMIEKYDKYHTYLIEKLKDSKAYLDMWNTSA